MIFKFLLPQVPFYQIKYCEKYLKFKGKRIVQKIGLWTKRIDGNRADNNSWIVLLNSLLWWEVGTNSLITGPGEWLSFRRFTSKLSWSWSRIDEKLFFQWFLTLKSENFSVFRILAGRWKIPKAKPIVSQTLECGLPQKFPTQIKLALYWAYWAMHYIT